ncbi:hypothetical protein [Paenibacillus sp. IHB B 3415]|uniref:hypothetical protein n=1 Tax=Paenibacillus sp. IHB B 3415 TaxID=867080 RepID=UPI00069C3F44|nr:hypothetical protein [Paenibacillus sp. IHB B 3415]
MIWIILAFSIFIIQNITIVIIEYRRPDKAAAWLMIQFMIPLIGFLAYYLMAKKYTRHPILSPDEYRRQEALKTELILRCNQRAQKNRPVNDTVINNQFEAFLQKKLSVPITACNETIVYSESEQAFEAILESIAAAKQHIHIEVYIIREDDLGIWFEKVLIQKAQEGVNVRCCLMG